MPVVNPSSGTKAGTVNHFASSSAPNGWLKANGALVSRSAYAALFAVIGTTFGAGDGSTTFALPDLRGEFVRSLDDGRGVDSGRGIGTFQSQDMQGHQHLTGVAVEQNPWGINTARYGWGSGWAGARTSSGGGTGFETYTSTTGNTETRPRNLAMLACIKY